MGTCIRPYGGSKLEELLQPLKPRTQKHEYETMIELIKVLYVFEARYTLDISTYTAPSSDISTMKKERNQGKMHVIKLCLCFCLSSLSCSLALRERLSKSIIGLSLALLQKVMSCFNCGYCFMGNFYWFTGFLNFDCQSRHSAFLRNEQDYEHFPGFIIWMDQKHNNCPTLSEGGKMR